MKPTPTDMRYVGRRLCTRDGRKIGNAFCFAATEHGMMRIETDFGNFVQCGVSFIKEHFRVTSDFPQQQTYAEWRAARIKGINTRQ